MQDRPSVSLVIPMYNEELNIEHAVDRGASRRSRATRGDYEIIIVDDASTDRSPRIVPRAGRGRIRASACCATRTTASSAARCAPASPRRRRTSCSTWTPTFPFDPDVLGRAIRAMEVTGADMIAGYRHDRTMEGLQAHASTRYVYNGLIGVLFGWPHRDINFSFKLMKREVLEAIELKSEGSLIDAELIVKAKNRGFTIQQIGIDYFPRIRGSRTSPRPASILKILRELVQLYPEMRRRARRGTGAGVRGDARRPRRRVAERVERTLIVTADDVGLHRRHDRRRHPRASRGDRHRLQHRRERRAFEDAVERLRDVPRLEVGVHLTLVEERPLSPPERVRSLTDRHGAFLRDFRLFTQGMFSAASPRPRSRRSCGGRSRGFSRLICELSTRTAINTCTSCRGSSRSSSGWPRIRNSLRSHSPRPGRGPAVAARTADRHPQRHRPRSPAAAGGERFDPNSGPDGGDPRCGEI